MKSRSVYLLAKRLIVARCLRRYLHFGGGGERHVTGGSAVLSLLLHGLRPHQCGEGRGQVPAQQRLLRRDVQQQCQRLGGEARF